MRKLKELGTAWRRLGRTRRILVGGLAGAVVGAIAIAIIGSGPASATDYQTPITAAFFYDESFRHTSDHYHPAVGFDSDNPTSVAAQVAGMRHAGMQAAIASWWGQGQHGEATRFPILRDAATAAGLGLIPYYEPEGQASQTVARIQADLAYLAPLTTVRVGGKPVIFVYNARSDTSNCATVTKWKQAAAGWYFNLKVFPGFASCPDQPSSWHQYGPANPTGESVHLPYSFNISPGFWHHNETTPRLARDPVRWANNVAHLKASTAQWKLVTSWNEWGEATSVEPSGSWQSSSGWGFYADELRRQLVDNQPAPSPSPSPTGSPTPSPTATTPSPSPTTPSPSPTTPSPSPTGTPPGSVTVMAAGDVVDVPPCNGYNSGCQDGWTAELITKYQPSAVLALGDLQYEQGSAAQFAAGWGRTSCASPSDCDAWGKHLGVMYPAPGNHEWLTANAQGYRDYFGARLAQIGSDTPSPNPQLYYSYDLGAWHFVSLDSDCSPVGGCGANRPMTNWLIQDLAANNGRPTIVYYHHATWSSGSHGSRTDHEELKRIVLADTDVQIVLAGHDHDYERFAPMGQSGPDPSGARYFVVGTGGKGPVCGTSRIPGSQVYNCTTMGLLRLTLSATGYSWQYHPAGEVGGPATTFTDFGSSGLRSGASSSPSPSLTPSPTASPSPTVSPSPTSVVNCMPNPHLCGYPDATNTGVDPVVVLTPVNGDLIMNQPGHVYSGLDIQGCAFAAADNVTLQQSIVRDDCWRSGRSSTYLIDNDDKPWHVTIDHVTVNASAVRTYDQYGVTKGHNRMNIKGISGSNLTIRSVEFIGGADCVHYSSNVVVEDSFCDLPLIPASLISVDPHVDGFQSAGGSNVILRHNTIRNPNDQTSAIINGTTPGVSAPQFNVRMLDNLMAGGGWTVYGNAHNAAVSPTIEFRNNRISRRYYTWPIGPNHPADRGGYWGPMTDLVGVPGAETTVWDETNQRIPVT